MNNSFLVSERTEILTMTIKRIDGYDLDEMTAREQAESQLRNEGRLGGWGGEWYFSGTIHTNYNEVRVEFTK